MSKDLRLLIGISFGLLLIKLCLLPWVQNIDADAVSRILITEEWITNLSWKPSQQWLPFHIYLIGVSLWIWDNVLWMPSLVNILISTLTLFPFYFLVNREFSSKGALYATVLFAFCPVLFHNSFLSLSGTPFVFFLILALNLFSKGIKEKTNWIYIAGLMYLICEMIRFESWLLLPVFSIGIIYLKKYKILPLLFLFPIIWLWENYVNTGSIFSSFDWAVNAIKNDVEITWEQRLRRGWFFPFSIFISLGPVSVFLLIKKFKFKSLNFKKKGWLIVPFIFLFIVFLWNAQQGSLLLQHRFSSTLIVLLFPFLSFIFEGENKKIFFVSLLTMFVLSMVWNTKGIKPIPRLKNQKIVQICNNFPVTKEETILINFMGFEDTYFALIELKSKGYLVKINQEGLIKKDFDYHIENLEYKKTTDVQ